MGGALQAITELAPAGLQSSAPGVLSARRFKLRKLGREDFDAWRRFQIDNAAAKKLTEPAWPDDLGDPAASPEAYERLIERLDEAARLGLHYAFGVHTDEGLIGEAQLSDVALSGPRDAIFGMFLADEHMGKQISQEIFVVLCRFAFDDLGLHRVELAALPDNEAARRAATKAGLRSEGVSQRYLRVGDEWVDHERFVITAEEWAERRDELEAAFLNGD